MNQRALVTGASGFVGRHLCEVLVKRGIHVVSLSRRGARSSPSREHIELDDILDAHAVEAAMREARPDLVFHLAGTVDASEPIELYRVNTLFGLTLMRCAARLATRPVLLVTGSVAEYGRTAGQLDLVPETAPCQPASPYGISKLAQTLHCLNEYGDRGIVARLFNPVGAGMRPHLALGNFTQQFAAMGPQGGELHTGSLSALRDFVDVQAAANCLADLAAMPAAHGRIVNICSGIGTSLREIVTAMITSVRKPVTLVEDASRGSPVSGKVDRVVGDPALLRQLGLTPPRLDVAALARSLTTAIDDVDG